MPVRHAWHFNDCTEWTMQTCFNNSNQARFPPSRKSYQATEEEVHGLFFLIRATRSANLLEVNRQYLKTIGGRENNAFSKASRVFASSVFQNGSGLIFPPIIKIFLLHIVELLFRELVLADFPTSSL